MDNNNGTVSIVYRGVSTDYPTVLDATISTSANTVTMGSSNVLESTATDNQYNMAATTNNKMLLVYLHQSDLHAQMIVFTPTGTSTNPNLTTENFIGLADKTSSANGESKVRIGGIDTNNSGLTSGQLIYVKNDGSLSETAESGKVVEVGKAISATKLLVNTS